MPALVNIRKFLDRLRRRLWVVVLVRQLGIYFAGLGLLALVLILAASVLDHQTSLRVLGVLIGLPLTVGFLLYLIGSMRRVRDDRGLTGCIGEKLPRLRSDLLSTLELGQELESEGNTYFSRHLYDALAGETWRRLSLLPHQVIVPPRRLQAPAILLTLVILTWAAAAASLPGYLRHGAARLLASGFHAQGEVAKTLLVGDLVLSFRYPAHMGRSPRTVQSSTGHITAPKGTRVMIQAATLSPLAPPAALLLDRRGHKAVRLGLTFKNQTLRGSVTITAEGTYRFQANTSDGRLVLDPVVRRIHIEPDGTPRATIYGPKPGAAVTAQHHLEVGYAVEDDYGIARVDLVHQVGSSPPTRTTLWRPGKQRRRTSAGKHDWDLADLDLPPGARVSYWIEAVDNDTISGPKTGRSTTLQFKIYSAEEKHLETIRHQQELVEQAIRLLADRLLLHAKKPATSASLRLEKNLAVSRSHGVLVDGLRELRNRMRRDRLVSRTLQRSISQMHQRMSVLLRAETALLKTAVATRRRNPARPVNLEPLRDLNRRLVAEMERDVLLLAKLLDEQRLQNMMTLSRNLDRARKRLAELLRRYRKTRSPELKRELLRQILRMERQVSQLMARMKKLSTSIPDEYLNSEALKNLDLRQDLRRLYRQIQSGKLDQVEAALRALDKKLSQLGSMLDSNLQQYRQGRMSAREKAFAAMLDRLRGLEAEQRQIADRTGRVIRRYHQRAAQLMKHKINPFVRRELAKLTRLKRRVNEVDASVLAPYDQEQLERIRQRVQDLKGMLDQGDLDEALRMALRTRNGLQVLQDDLAEELEGQHPRRRTRVRRSLRKTRSARKLADELVADLRGIFPHPRSLLDRGDLGQLRKLQRRQGTLRRRVQQLRAQLEQKKGSPMVGEGVPQTLQEASGLMGKAGQKLRRLQPQEAHGSQEAAAERLAQLRRQMKQSRQPRQWSQGGPSVLRERVRIPGADAFRAPKEFREDILDAMKEKAPRTFQGQVKRYYEELVR